MLSNKQEHCIKILNGD